MPRKTKPTTEAVPVGPLATTADDNTAIGADAMTNVTSGNANVAIGGLTDDSSTVQPVKVTVTRDHCLLPHSIELRKDENGFIIDARTEDWRHVYTIGAKTVEEIFREVGYEIPADHEIELEIIISPYTGEVIAIQPKKAEDLSLLPNKR
jgi:hypothetical protein